MVQQLNDRRLFYKVQEAAEVLAQGRTRVYTAIANGELRSIKVGRSRLVPVQALLDYAAKLEAQGSEAP